MYPFACRVLKNSKEREVRKASSVITAKKYRKIRWERLEITSRKLEIPRQHFMPRWSQ